MTRVTVDVDDQVAQRAQQVAAARNTTVAEMLRHYLESIAVGDAAGREQARLRLVESFVRLSRDMGPRSWTREDLYAR